MTSNTTRMRSVVMAMAALLLGAGLLFSPRLAQQVYAQGSTCSANCANGSCTASGTTCSCTCSMWLQLPVCECHNEN
jgi:hypothetical protein